MEADITVLINFALDLKESEDYGKFDHYKYELSEWARKEMSSIHNDHIKDIIIRILELRVDYPKWYRLLVLTKFQIDVLSEWHERGKYKLYVDRSISLLEALRFRLRVAQK